MKRSESKKRRIWPYVLLSILLVIILLIVGAYIWLRGQADDRLSLMPTIPTNFTPPSPSQVEEYLQENTDPSDPEFTGPVYEPEDIEWETLPETPVEEDPDVVNLLLIGADVETYGSSRSDALILCTINRHKKTVTMTSFLRDTYLRIPGYGSNRINASYFFGGVDLLNETITHNFGIQIDGNFLVDFDSFRNVIDEAGGVDIELTQAEANYLNKPTSWAAGDSHHAGGYTAGINHLNGAAALTYSRDRTTGGSDFARTQRQRIVLTALFERCKTMSIAELDNMLTTLLPCIATDMRKDDIYDLAVSMIPMLSDMTISTGHIPPEGAYQLAWVSEMSVILPNLEKCREELERIVAP